MKQVVDRAIVLSRVEYGERDRILTLLCREQGKISAIAKGARSQKSKLAGGIELLGESEVTLIKGKTDLYMLSGARLRAYFGNIVTNIERTKLAFECFKGIHKTTEEGTGQDYYPTLLRTLQALNDYTLDVRIIRVWFSSQILLYFGSLPDMRPQDLQSPQASSRFSFDYDRYHFVISETDGDFTVNDLKLLKLCRDMDRPPKLRRMTGSEDRLAQLMDTLLKTNVTAL